MEQLLRVHSYDSRTWVSEHEPTTGLAAGRLAQLYENAHQTVHGSQTTKSKAQYTQPSSGDRIELSHRPQNGNEGAQGINAVAGHKLICFALVCPARKANLMGFFYTTRE